MKTDPAIPPESVNLRATGARHPVARPDEPIVESFLVDAERDAHASDHLEEAGPQETDEPEDALRPVILPPDGQTL